MKIVVAEKMSSSAINLLRQPGWTVITPDQLNGKLVEELETADALLVRSAVQVDAQLLSGASRLRVIGRAGVGVDNIELEPATRKGIAVMNTPGANAVAVAEHTLGLMLAMARFIPRANQLTHAGKWEKKSLQGTELRGKTLGIVGLGKIGLEVAKRARAFGMELLAHDPFVSAVVAKDNGIRLVSLDEVYAAADYLSLHVGLTPQTQAMINLDAFKKMKRGVRLVNCARGELIDEAALVGACQEGQVAAAALDVFVQEPLQESPLQQLENVILTPHIAGATNEAQEAVGQQIAMQVKEYLEHGVIQNAVNVPSVSHEEYLELKPYVTLAERLGSFLAQISGGSLLLPLSASETTSFRLAQVLKSLRCLGSKARPVGSSPGASEKRLRIFNSLASNSTISLLSSRFTKMCPFSSEAASSGTPPSARVPTAFISAGSIAVVSLVPWLNVKTRRLTGSK